MENNEVIEGNKLIAEFMEFDKDWKPSHPEESYHYPTLFYHLSWDWLMPVVDKIGKDYCIEITYPNEKVSIFDSQQDYVNIDEWAGENESIITPVYKAVINFIKWYKTTNLK